MKKLKEQMLLANKVYKTEIINNVILNVLLLVMGGLLVFLTNNILLIVYIIGAASLFNVYYFTRYSRIISKNKNKLIDDFINVFSYFRIYVTNNRNVYVSLKEIANYATPFLKLKLIELTNKMDEDKSLQPFIDFSSNFNDKKVEEVMISIYEMIDEGNSEVYINQFVSTFMSFKSRVSRVNEDKRSSRFNMINSLSIVGIGILMVIILFGIVSLLGDMTI